MKEKRYAIEADGLGKRYYLGEDNSGQRFRHALRNILPSIHAGGAPELWALRDASFKIEPGEAVGIIGRNGAGKSTLLKVLSRITAPTEGRARVRGRVGTLLEVGTGFHPELTGRDNIFLSGTILGMTYAEVARRFDEIVAFSEIEKFIDTPVKRYSSGMYVRLAFAVASFLEPEILIVDEVLAVGDANFQRKSLGRLNEASSKEGRTVLFVSHSLQAIRTFCKRVLVVEDGRISFDGPTAEGIDRYLRSVPDRLDIRQAAIADRLNRTSGAVRFTAVTASDDLGAPTWTFEAGKTIKLRFEYEALERVNDLAFVLQIRSPVDGQVFSAIREVISTGPVEAGRGGAVELTLLNAPLRPSEFSLSGSLTRIDDGVQYDIVDNNVGLPLLTITSDTTEKYARQGYVSFQYEFAQGAAGEFAS